MDDPEFLPLGMREGYHFHPEPFGIGQTDRRSHMWVLGASGTGKTSFIQGRIQADIAAGRGVGLIDPHGDLAREVIAAVPPERVGDVVLLDMADTDWPVALNVLQGAPTPEAVASSLVGAFKDYFGDMWGPRLEYCLYHSLAALAAAKNTSLLSLHRLLVDEEYRAQVLRSVTDPTTRFFWHSEFPTNDRDRREWVSPIQNKIGQFFGNPFIRNAIGQPSGRVFLRRVMDTRGIFIARISAGILGPAMTNLFGSLLVSLFEAAAMAREDTPEEERVDFHLYVEEFQKFSSMSFAHALAEVRKYRLNLILVNQYTQSLTEEVLDAVLGNCATIISFRVGGQDSQILSRAFADSIPAPRFVNLARRQILVRMLEQGVEKIPFAGETLDLVPADFGTREKIRQQTRDKYARPRAAVEEQIDRFFRSMNSAGRKSPP
jgi:hypothetical protein